VCLGASAVFGPDSCVMRYTTSTGVVTDGSGVSLYSAGSRMQWIIAPAGVSTAQLTLTELDTEVGADLLGVLKCTDNTCTSTSQIGQSVSGRALRGFRATPPGIMLVTFSSNGALNGAGFSAGWAAASIGLCGDMFQDLGEDCDDGGVVDGDGCSSSCAVESGFSCSGASTSYGPDQCSPLLTAVSGSFSDGSGVFKYLPNTDALWILAPSGLSEIRIELSSLDTQLGHDFLSVFLSADADASAGEQRVGERLSGTGARAIKVPSGFARLYFSSDASVQAQGFSVSWSAAGSATCGDMLRDAGEECDDGNVVDGYSTHPTAPTLRALPFAPNLCLVFRSLLIPCPGVYLEPEYDQNHLHPEIVQDGQ